MNNKHSSHPLICIDFKKNRIRIHRNTLRQIGNPEYIQLLVNPDQKIHFPNLTFLGRNLTFFV